MWLHHRYRNSDFKRNCWIKFCTRMKELVCKLLLRAHAKIRLQNAFLRKPNKGNRKKQAKSIPPYQPQFSVFIKTLKKGRILETWLSTYLILFFMVPFSLFSFSLMAGAHLLHEQRCYQRYSGITKYAFSGTSCFKSLKSDVLDNTWQGNL